MREAMGLPERIQALEDRESVKELRYEYGRRLDDNEWDGWGDLFTEDAVGTYEGWGEFEGREALTEFASTTVADAFEYTAHVMHHPSIELDERTGRGQWYVEIHYARSDGTAGWRQGRYFDEYRKVDGEWLFASVAHTFYARQQFDYVQTDDERFGELIEFGEPHES